MDDNPTIVTDIVKCDQWLLECVGREVRDYLPEKSRRYIYDWKKVCTLLDTKKELLEFYDYSFTISPMYKATEHTLHKIAIDLGLEIPNAQLGSYYNKENINKKFDTIEAKFGKSKEISEIREHLKQTGYFLVRYRHRPAHSSHTVPTYENAKMISTGALSYLTSTITDLIHVGLIPQNTSQVNDKPF